jgi:tRNA (adenine37-N6)-methyltransferase
MIPASSPARSFSLTPIGHVRTPWSKGNCPKNMTLAREAGRPATLMIDPPWRQGLTGLERATHLILLGWFDADRDVLLQKPPHLSVAQGCFALRTPARPNPIGVSIVRRSSLGLAAGLITVDALDWYDGTALLDIKPYYPSTDVHADAQVQDL